MFFQQNTFPSLRRESWWSSSKHASTMIQIQKFLTLTRIKHLMNFCITKNWRQIWSILCNTLLQWLTRLQVCLLWYSMYLRKTIKLLVFSRKNSKHKGYVLVNARDLYILHAFVELCKVKFELVGTKLIFYNFLNTLNHWFVN